MEGTTYEFGVSGDLYNNNLLLYDRQTRSEWLQLLGTAVEGPLTGRRLRPYPISFDTWLNWKTHHPKGKVLSIHTPYEERFGSYSANPYSGYEADARLLFRVNHEDNRLARKERVIGIEIRGAYKAYPEAIVWKRGAIEDRAGREDVVLLADRDSSSIGLFPREARHFSMKNGAVFDEAGTEWRWDGATLTAGDRVLTSFAVIPTYWFAWAALHPDTELYLVGAPVRVKTPSNETMPPSGSPGRKVRPD